LVPTEICAAHHPDLAGVFLVGKGATGEGGEPAKLKQGDDTFFPCQKYPMYNKINESMGFCWDEKGKWLS
jgi:hypothetical protein